MIRCGRCQGSSEDVVLFYLPGRWAGGQCQSCLLASEETASAFRDHFGEVRHVSDGDRGKGVPKA